MGPKRIWRYRASDTTVRLRVDTGYCSRKQVITSLQCIINMCSEILTPKV